jgi:hypothetical protein
MVSTLAYSGLNTRIFLISGFILLKSHSFISIWFMMKAQLTFRRAQKLTQELQRVLEEDPLNLITTNTRTKFTSNVLEPAFEWDRNRRSAAPSPEILPGNESQELTCLVCLLMKTIPFIFILKIYAKASTGEASAGSLDFLTLWVGKQTECRCCDVKSLAKRVVSWAGREEI